MRKFNIVLFLLLCLILGGLLLLRRHMSAVQEASPVPIITEIPQPTPVPTATAVPMPLPSPTASPEPTPTAAPFIKPQGYTEESYNLVSDMVYAYADRQEAAVDIIRADLERLAGLDPALGALWAGLMQTWSMVNTDLTLNPGVLPAGLPEDESLCIVVLGFQLESDGSMAPELVGRCETALRCAERYPNALIAVTGGGTAWSNPSATEAGVMAEWLIVHGIAPDRILKEDASRTTADNAVFTCRLLQEQHPEVKALAVVSSDYHLPLGVLLFQEQALLEEYETGILPFTVVSNAAFDTGGRLMADSPMMQKSYLWSLADPHY